MARRTKNSVLVEEQNGLKTIIEALDYLLEHCSTQTTYAIIETTRALCLEMWRLEQKEGELPFSFTADIKGVLSGNVVNALEFLRDEAGRNQHRDAEVLLDAAFKICVYICYYEFRGTLKRRPPL